MLKRYQLSASDLHIEITESAIMVDMVRVRRTIEELSNGSGGGSTLPSVDQGGLIGRAGWDVFL